MEQDLARFLAFAIKHLGGSLKISREALDNMLPTRLVWDTTSDPRFITVATISNEVIQLTVEKSTPVEDTMPVVPSPEHDLAPPPECDPVIQEETRGHDEPQDDD